MVQNKKWWKKSGKVECFFCMVLIKVNQWFMKNHCNFFGKEFNNRSMKRDAKGCNFWQLLQTNDQ